MDNDEKEHQRSSPSNFRPQTLTLQKAVDMGEYDSSVLATFPEWHLLSPHMRFLYIKEALDNRYKQLMMQWSEINNILDSSKKPQMQKALDNIQDQIHKVESDREKIYFEYSNKG